MNNYSNLSELFKRISILNYVVIRNYENINDEINKGGDIDFLCINRDEFSDLIGAEKIVEAEDRYNYRISISNRIIPIDIREVGDDYFDSKWEEDIILTRKKYDDFYVMDDENYRYTLLYHVLIHKKSISEKYHIFIEDKFGCNVNKFDCLIDELCIFLRRKGYKLVKPNDVCVDFNMSNYLTLVNSMEATDV